LDFKVSVLVTPHVFARDNVEFCFTDPRVWTVPDEHLFSFVDILFLYLEEKKNTKIEQIKRKHLVLKIEIIVFSKKS